jgi:hypothetical protein
MAGLGRLLASTCCRRPCRAHNQRRWRSRHGRPAADPAGGLELLQQVFSSLAPPACGSASHVVESYFLLIFVAQGPGASAMWRRGGPTAFRPTALRSSSRRPTMMRASPWATSPSATTLPRYATTTAFPWPEKQGGEEKKGILFSSCRKHSNLM